MPSAGGRRRARAARVRALRPADGKSCARITGCEASAILRTAGVEREEPSPADGAPARRVTGGKPFKEVGAQQAHERDIVHSPRELRRLTDGNVLHRGIGKRHKTVVRYVEVFSERRGEAVGRPPPHCYRSGSRPAPSSCACTPRASTRAARAPELFCSTARPCAAPAPAPPRGRA